MIVPPALVESALGAMFIQVFTLVMGAALSMLSGVAVVVFVEPLWQGG